MAVRNIEETLRLTGKKVGIEMIQETKICRKQYIELTKRRVKETISEQKLEMGWHWKTHVVQRKM